MVSLSSWYSHNLVIYHTIYPIKTPKMAELTTRDFILGTIAVTSFAIGAVSIVYLVMSIVNFRKDRPWYP